MGKELAKFETEFNRIKSKYSAVTAGKADVAANQVRLANGTVVAGGDELKSRLVTARKKGVKGKTTAHFMRDAGFADGVKLMTIANTALETRIKDFEEYVGKAIEAYMAMYTLAQNIEKDLKNRSLLSESKKDIQTLQDKVEAQRKVYEPESKRTLKDFYRVQAKSLQKEIDDIVKDAPADLEDYVATDELEAKLKDRVLNSRLSKCEAGYKEVAALCASGKQKAKAGDKPGAKADLKAALLRYKEVAAIATDYQSVVTKSKDHVDNSKDKNTILASVKKMVQSQTGCETETRELAAAIKG
jgi:hypothetical protein